MKVTFLNPGERSDPFFGPLVRVMEKAAVDLGIDLEVDDCGRDEQAIRERGVALTDRPSPPDYVVLSNLKGVTGSLLPRLDGAGIRTLLVNEGLMAADRGSIGSPRETLPHWLGELVPDDAQAGRLLAEELLGEAEAHGLHGADGKIHVCGLSGTYTFSSIHRLNGLRAAITAHGGAVLDEVPPAGWDRGKAFDRTLDLVRTDPDLRVIWSASDLMALGALEAIEEAGKEPGREVLVGGIDWAEEACEEVRKGRLTVSVGGHFYDGAWALVLLHDHFHGRDFRTTSFRSEFAAMTPKTRDLRAPLLRGDEQSGLDFRRFSLLGEPEDAEYDFSLDRVLGMLGRG